MPRGAIRAPGLARRHLHAAVVFPLAFFVTGRGGAGATVAPIGHRAAAGLHPVFVVVNRRSTGRIRSRHSSERASAVNLA